MKENIKKKSLLVLLSYFRTAVHLCQTSRLDHDLGLEKNFCHSTHCIHVVFSIIASITKEWTNNAFCYD